MKVLHMISGGDKGGAKTHVLTLLSALNEDIEINIVCFFEGEFYKELQKMPIPSLLFEQKHRFDLSVIKKLRRHIREEGYDLVHVHGARANFIAFFLKLFIKIPVITTMHSDYKLDFTQNLYKRFIFTGINSVSLRHMDYYIAVSDSFKKMLVDRRFPEGRIYTVYNAIDFSVKIDCISKKEFLSRFGINAEGKTLIGIIGRFEKVKGHEVFLNAAAQVIKQRQDVLFLLAGEGTEQPGLEELCAKLGISDNVRFLGFVTDIYNFFNAIDVNVLSSYSESFPYVLLEGAMMKKATVSTAVGGIPDLLKHNETGLLVPAGNSVEMAKCMLALAADENLRIRLGNSLSEFAKTNFSKDSMKNRHIEIYTDVLNRMKNEGKLFDVMLSGYYGFDNSGDDALLKSIIERLRAECKDIKIAVLSRKRKETAALHNVAAVSRYNYIAISRHMKRSRAFVYGGGSLIQDYTSTKSLVYYTTVLFMAKRLGLKIALYANGIGPIIRKYNEKTAAKALMACDYISLRDNESLAELRRLTSEKCIANVTVDPAFSILCSPKERISEIIQSEGIDKSKKYFGVSFRNWDRNDPKFVPKMASVIDDVSEEHGLAPLYLPMHPSDSTIMREVRHLTANKGAMLAKVYDAPDYLGIIALTEFMIAMRLHAVIYGFSMNVPSVGIVYDPKVSSVYEQTDQSSYVSTEDIDCELIKKMAREIIKNLPERKRALNESVAKLKRLVDRDAHAIIELSGCKRES